MQDRIEPPSPDCKSGPVKSGILPTRQSERTGIVCIIYIWDCPKGDCPSRPRCTLSGSTVGRTVVDLGMLFGVYLIAGPYRRYGFRIKIGPKVEPNTSRNTHTKSLRDSLRRVLLEGRVPSNPDAHGICPSSRFYTAPSPLFEGTAFSASSLTPSVYSKSSSYNTFGVVSPLVKRDVVSSCTRGGWPR
jgi:hypothetical protein